MSASFYALAVSTLFFTINTVLLPRDHIPWPLPEGYRLRDDGICSKNKDEPPEPPLQIPDNPINGSTIETKDNNNKYVTVNDAFDGVMSSGFYSNLNENGVMNNHICSDDVSIEKRAASQVAEPETGEKEGSILAKDVQDNEKKNGRVMCHDNAGYEHEREQAQDGNFDDIPETGHQSAGQELDNEADVRVDVELSKAARRATRDKLTEDQRVEDFPTTWSVLRSPMFLLMTLWTIAVQGEIFFVIGIMNPWLTFLADGDTETVSFYTNILAIATIGSLFGSPIMGYVFDRRKQRSEKSPKKDNTKGPYADLRDSWLPVALASGTAIVMSLLLMIPNLPAQFGTFVALTAVRAMFYSASAAIVPISFPMRFYPTVFGATNFIAGLVSLTQYPLFIVIQESLGGDPRWVIFGMMLLNVVGLVYPIYIYVYGNNREKRYMETRRQENPTTNGTAA
eukprot:XP_011683136.1 PREDICTED: large neutral amino acids transporter small subunit 3-like [Strongylocentrotus purpuratus]